jgi:hypothetical protein
VPFVPTQEKLASGKLHDSRFLALAQVDLSKQFVSFTRWNKAIIYRIKWGTRLERQGQHRK